jgi:hypothetical protein
MGRYSLGLRSIYDRDEPTGGERIAKGISGAIDSYLAHDVAGKANDSARRAAGQVKVGERTAGDRVRGVMQGARRIFGRGGDEPTPPPFVPGAPLQPTVLPNANAMRQPDEVADAPNMYEPLRQTPNMAPAPSATPTNAVPTAPATVARSTGRATIGNALAEYTDEDQFGNSWKVDPMFAEKQKLAGSEMEYQQGEQHRTAQEQEKIEAAVRAGMPRAEAEARVKNNLMRYDETFGQARPQQRLTVEEQRELIAARGEQARLTAKSRTPGGLTPQERARLYDLKERELDLRSRGQDLTAEGRVASGEVAVAGAIDKGIPKDPITVATQTPEQRKAAETRGAERDKHIGEASKSVDRIRNGRATPDQIKARAQELQKTIKDRAALRAALQAEGYHVQ